MRDFPDFVEICPVCQHLAVLPDISLSPLSSDHIWSWQFLKRIFRRFRKRSPSIPVISLSLASLCSARMLIKYSKPNAVRARRNAFMSDFPDFVEIYPVCQHSAVLPDISLISQFIGSYLELAIFREDFSSLASVNVRFS